MSADSLDPFNHGGYQNSQPPPSPEPGKASPGASAPMVAAMILADVGYQDNLSRKVTLLGMFHKLVFPRLPAQVGCVLFLRLVDGRGDYPLILRIMEEDTGLVVCDQMLTISFKSPLEPLDTLIPLQFTAPRYTALIISIMDKHTAVGSLRLPVEAPKL